MIPAIHDFVSRHRGRFEDRDNNLFANALGDVIRYRSFLDIIVARYERLDAEFSVNFHAQMEAAKAKGPGYNGPASKEAIRLLEESQHLTLRLHLEVESFYTFAKILLDQVAHYFRYLFGPQQRVRFTSHHSLIETWDTLVEAVGIEGETGELLAQMQKLQSNIADFRDKQITHEYSPRTIRGTVTGGDAGARIHFSKIYPQEKEPVGQNITSGSIDELLEAIDRYILAVLELTRSNMGRSTRQARRDEPQ